MSCFVQQPEDINFRVTLGQEREANSHIHLIQYYQINDTFLSVDGIINELVDAVWHQLPVWCTDVVHY